MKLQNLSYLLKYPTVTEWNYIKTFLKKLHKFTNNSFRMVIVWKTRNIRSLFPLNDKNNYKSYVIYKGDCFRGSRYIFETKPNAEVRWNEHNNPTNSSELLKHLRTSINHCFTWTDCHFKCSKKMLRPGRT